jgi:hypothetical protein
VEIHADAISGRVVPPVLDAAPSPAERSEWIRELIETDRGFPDEVTEFDRSGLADATAAFAVGWQWGPGDPDPAQFAAGIQRAATVLGLIDPARPGTLAAWISDPDVQERIRTHLLAGRTSTRSAEWLAWISRRFTISAAQALLAAMTGGNAHVDADDLLIDLDDADPTIFHISEQSPGGTGQIEALVVDLIEAPERLPLALTDVLRPTDLELLDGQLRAVIDSGDTHVQAGVRRLALSWPEGHESVRFATERLDTALAAAALVLAHPAKVALSTRLAGPGASAEFMAEVREWLQVRDAAEQSSGFTVEPRSLAALLAGRADADAHLHIERADEARRARAIANVLWPWGRSARSNDLFNPYSGHGGGAIELLRNHWQLPTRVLEFSQWDEARRSEVHENLRDHGEVVIRVPNPLTASLRAALIDLQTIPIEVGPLWCYPEVLGLQDRGPVSEARLVLRETW